jgi:glycosyltransferase involved in cell wall biosynthesis
VRELIEGWKLFAQSRQSLFGTLLIVGDGPERQLLRKKVRSQGLQGVVFAGRINYDELPIYFSVADVLVMPTLEDNWSLVVPEAMACGKPVLCSCYNGCWPELVHPGINGWVFDPSNPHETSKHFSRCLEQQDYLSVMGQSSLAIVRQFTPQRAANAVLESCMLSFERAKGFRNCFPKWHQRGFEL